MNRWVIYCRDGTRMLYSRAVMAGTLGRLIDSDELVHHVDENPINDDPGNLELTTRREHPTIHARMRRNRRNWGI